MSAICFCRTLRHIQSNIPSSIHGASLVCRPVITNAPPQSVSVARSVLRRYHASNISAHENIASVTPALSAAHHDTPSTPHHPPQFTKRYWSRVISSQTFHSRRRNFWKRQHDRHLKRTDNLIHGYLHPTTSPYRHMATRNRHVVTMRYRHILRYVRYISAYDQVIAWYLTWRIKSLAHHRAHTSNIHTTRQYLQILGHLNTVHYKLQLVHWYDTVRVLKELMMYAYGYKGVVKRLLNEVATDKLGRSDTVTHDRLSFFPPLLQCRLLTVSADGVDGEQLFKQRLLLHVQSHHAMFNMRWLRAYESILGEYTLTVDADKRAAQMDQTYQRFAQLLQ